MKPTNYFPVLGLFILIQSGQIMAAPGLSMAAAEQLALQNDPLTKSFHQHAQAFEEQAVASDQWPDPKIKFGFLSVPTDSYDLDQEPMTQLVLGYSQMIPRGDSLQHAAGFMQAKAIIKRADMALRQRTVRRNVRKAWLKVYLQEASEKIIQQNRYLFKQQLDVSQSLYAAGRKQQQDVLQAELELSLLDDQLQQIASKLDQARAGLSQWVGADAATYSLLENRQPFNTDIQHTPGSLAELLKLHPLLKKKSANISASQKQLSLARQKYSPQWGFDVTYGKRDGENMDGSDRADFLSAMVNLDVPIFTEHSQDRVVAARTKQLQARRYEKQDAFLQLQSEFEQVYARWEKLKTRLHLYDEKVLPQAKQNAVAALNGYQSGVVSFFTLTRARSAELKAKLQRLKLNVEQAIAYADIRYFAGENLMTEQLSVEAEQ